ncbi:hypothetical protein ATCR1_15026 [Agrobacterium tumefaciens CCNWGS0286]|nr:hypothetical protein ATCR1_15026 [Agrobacterium tumefaciens CCNWGS0286]
MFTDGCFVKKRSCSSLIVALTLDMRRQLAGGAMGTSYGEKRSNLSSAGSSDEKIAAL